MRVLIVSFYYEPEIGAAPGRISNMAKGLKKSGFDVDVLTCLPNYPKGRIFEGYRHRFSKKEQLDGINVFRYWAYATVSKNAFKRVFSMTTSAISMFAFAFHGRLIKRYDTVIVQSPPIVVSASAIVLFKKLYGRKIVLNVSDLWPGSAVELGFMKPHGLSYSFVSRLERFIYKNADCVMGQSQEILDHILKYHPSKPVFLYRNLAKVSSVPQVRDSQAECPRGLKIVYAGLLGVPQDVLSIIRNIDFAAHGCEFHIYGGGNQADDIQQEIASGRKGVFYHGILSKDEMNAELGNYDISLISLVKSIKGAVPSKIFDIMPYGMPILFSGDGEGAAIVKDNKIGLVSGPSDFRGLENNISEFVNMDYKSFKSISDNCLEASNSIFNFNRQMEKFIKFLES